MTEKLTENLNHIRTPDKVYSRASGREIFFNKIEIGGSTRQKLLEFFKKCEKEHNIQMLDDIDLILSGSRNYIPGDETNPKHWKHADDNSLKYPILETTKKQKTIPLIFLTLNDFGLEPENMSMKNIITTAKNAGLELCPMDTAFYMCKKTYTAKGYRYLYFITDLKLPTKHSDTDPKTDLETTTHTFFIGYSDTGETTLGHDIFDQDFVLNIQQNLYYAFSPRPSSELNDEEIKARNVIFEIK